MFRFDASGRQYDELGSRVPTLDEWSAAFEELRHALIAQLLPRVPQTLQPREPMTWTLDERGGIRGEPTRIYKDRLGTTVTVTEAPSFHVEHI